MNGNLIFHGTDPIRRSPAALARLLVAVCAFLLCGLSAWAQAPAVQQAKQPPAPTVTIAFKDGRTVAASSLRRSGANVLANVPVGETMGEVAYSVDAIARIEFPEPGQLQTSTKLLLEGKAAAALKEIEPSFAYYEGYKDVPGNWWIAEALLKLKALQDLHRDTAADAVVAEMVQSAPANSDAARLAGVLQAANMARDGHPEKALPVYDDVIKASTDDRTLAYAWANKGYGLYALQKFDPALLAYLHVPVFYPDERLLLPSVLMGSGKCYVHIENLPEAEKAFNDLVEQFPSSPEADAAKAELKKLPQTPPEATPTPTPDSTSTTASPSPEATPAADATPAASPATPPANP